MFRFSKQAIYLFLILLSTNSFSRSLKFDKKSHDFGHVIRGERLTWQVGFQNTGKTDIRIQGVYSGCGCTAVELDEDRIYRPGERGSVLIRFDTENFLGKVSKQVIVISSEKRRSQTNLTVRAKIKEEFSIKPVLIDFGLVDGGAETTKKFTISPVDGFKLDVEGFEYNEDLFELTPVKKDTSWEVSLKLKKDVSSGFIKETIFAKTNSNFLSRVKIPVRVDVKDVISLSPSYIEFGTLKKSKSEVKTVSLSAPMKFSIVKFDAELLINNQQIKDAGDLLSVELSKEPASKKKLKITLNNSREMSGSVHGRITLQSDIERHKNVAFDFYAFFK